VALLLPILRISRRHAPNGDAPKRIIWGAIVGFISAGVLTVSYFVWMIESPVIQVWKPVGLLVLIGNIANIAGGVCVLLDFTAEGVIPALLIAINQFLWIVFGIMAFFFVDF
jgi:hypothetical protein